MADHQVTAGLLRDEIRAADYDRRALPPDRLAQAIEDARMKASACVVRSREHRAAGSPASAFAYDLRRLSYLRTATFLENGTPDPMSEAFTSLLEDALEAQEAARQILLEEVVGNYPLPWEDTVVISRCPRYNVGGRLVTALVSDGGGRGAYHKWNACILDQTYGAWVPIFPENERDFYTRDDAKAWVAGTFAKYRDGVA